jgi:hypothetical protein
MMSHPSLCTFAEYTLSHAVEVVFVVSWVAMTSFLSSLKAILLVQEEAV